MAVASFVSFSAFFHKIWATCSRCTSCWSFSFSTAFDAMFSTASPLPVASPTAAPAAVALRFFSVWDDRTFFSTRGRMVFVGRNESLDISTHSPNSLW